MGPTKPLEEKEKIKILRNKPPAPDVAQAGFSLLEITIVLFLMALMLGFVGSNLYKAWQKEQARLILRQVVSVLRQARSDAVAGNRKVKVHFNVSEQRYWLADAAKEVRPLPPIKPGGSQLVWQDQHRRQGYIVFYGDGSSSGGRLMFLNPGNQPFILDVDRITGQLNFGSR